MNSFTFKDLQNHLFEQLEVKTNEYQRAFHGRGGFYHAFEYLTIDYIDTIVYVALFEEIDENSEKELFHILKLLFQTTKFEAIVVQRRYIKQSVNEVLYGTLSEKTVACENGLLYQLNFSDNQNIGFFADMKVGRNFVKEHSKQKSVLNLFSYTCAFSICAMSGQASKVVNVDMAKNALTTGRANHHLNGLSTQNVQFMPYNILKSWNRIKKAGPYDLIIIDPPSFQKGSFAATKDYVKIIKKLPELAASNCTILACLNDPKLDTQFLLDLFKEHVPNAIFQTRLENVKEFKSVNEESSLKNLIFTLQS